MLLLLVALPLLVHSAPNRTDSLPADCEDIYNNGSIHNGVYTIYPAGSAGQPVQVYCDMGCKEDESHGDERWTVIQRRFDGSVNFFQPWDEYKNGFGNANGEYWLGLENIYLLTNMEQYQLKVDMEDFNRGSAYAQYRSFYIDPEASSYALHISEFIDGGAGDPLSSINGKIFSTYDKTPYGSCADSFYGGFWYTCWWSNGVANPNGLYKVESVASAYLDNGVLWTSWQNYYSMKSISMKIRRVNIDDISET
ncbi:microfibril-associated glycoprotein 4-like [Silurus meridionalis]|uniref:Fibrinogen C-terminal domain-containing protein n=1 Tax=Silurus meridionalis TaxID=175797 RepID=A0A8T0AD53_SILME|nr:microfibril-associated glycoprotein 4-like [Silurus meridionalis]XP_046693023.1 microfibril-associated glycoprotein 4-like [Silurus meridionalis]KAF7689199.1 hypothetical protein HF521_012552 [Silurus meridionalis]